MSTADGYVVPKPGVPKTLGILSTVFAVLMILYGLCVTGYMAVLPAIMSGSTQVLKKAAEKVDADQKAQIKSLEDQEQAATTDEQKASLKQQRDAIAAQPKAPAIDFTEVTAAATNPTIMTYYYVNLLTGLILAIVLLISGIGLIRLTAWGRSLSIAWGGLQIVQVVAMAIVNLIFVLPVQQEVQKKMMDKLMAQANAQNGGAANPAANGAVTGAQMAKAMSAAGGVMIVFTAIVGCVYPIVLLIMLNSASARAACQPKGTPGLDGF